MDEARRTGLPCSVSLLGVLAGRHASLYPRISSHENDASADASGATLYFMLCSQLDTAFHVLANCPRLRPPTERLTNKWFQRGE